MGTGLAAARFRCTASEPQRLTILNVAGQGGPLTFAECVRLAGANLIQVPTEKLFRLVLEFLWRTGISTIPPDVAPYMTSDTLMDTSRLAMFLGIEYQNVIRYSIADAFRECFEKAERAAAGAGEATGGAAD